MGSGLAREADDPNQERIFNGGSGTQTNLNKNRSASYAHGGPSICANHGHSARRRRPICSRSSYYILSGSILPPYVAHTDAHS